MNAAQGQKVDGVITDLINRADDIAQKQTDGSGATGQLRWEVRASVAVELDTDWQICEGLKLQQVALAASVQKMQKKDGAYSMHTFD